MAVAGKQAPSFMYETLRFFAWCPLGHLLGSLPRAPVPPLPNGCRTTQLLQHQGALIIREIAESLESRGDKRAPFECALCSLWHLCIAWPFLGLVIAHFNSLSKEAIERRGGKEGMEGRCEVVKAKDLAENKVHTWKVHVCPLLIEIVDIVMYKGLCYRNT